jgi:hypothetical protein
VSLPRVSPLGKIESRAVSSGRLVSLSQAFTAEIPSAYALVEASKTNKTVE